MVHFGKGGQDVIDGPILEEVIGQGFLVGQVQTSQVLQFIDEHFSYHGQQLLSDLVKIHIKALLNVEILETLRD